MIYTDGYKSYALRWLVVAMQASYSSGSLYATRYRIYDLRGWHAYFSVTRKIFIRCRFSLTFSYIPSATSIFNTVDVDIRYDWRKWYFVPSYDTMATFAKRSRARWRDSNTVVERRFHARGYIEAYVYWRMRASRCDIDKHEVVKRVFGAYRELCESVRTLNK